jgi:hypothetical protein
VDSSTVGVAVVETLEVGWDEVFHGPANILTRLLPALPKFAYIDMEFLLKTGFSNRDGENSVS